MWREIKWPRMKLLVGAGDCGGGGDGGTPSTKRSLSKRAIRPLDRLILSRARVYALEAEVAKCVRVGGSGLDFTLRGARSAGVE
jgi:hypothetical protein